MKLNRSLWNTLLAFIFALITALWIQHTVTQSCSFDSFDSFDQYALFWYDSFAHASWALAEGWLFFANNFRIVIHRHRMRFNVGHGVNSRGIDWWSIRCRFTVDHECLSVPLSHSFSSIVVHDTKFKWVVRCKQISTKAVDIVIICLLRCVLRSITFSYRKVWTHTHIHYTLTPQRNTACWLRKKKKNYNDCNFTWCASVTVSQFLIAFSLLRRIRLCRMINCDHIRFGVCRVQAQLANKEMVKRSSERRKEVYTLQLMQRHALPHHTYGRELPLHHDCHLFDRTFFSRWCCSLLNPVWKKRKKPNFAASEIQYIYNVSIWSHSAVTTPPTFGAQEKEKSISEFHVGRPREMFDEYFELGRSNAIRI